MKHDSSLKANNSTREYTPPQTFVKPANCHADKKSEIVTSLRPFKFLMTLSYAIDVKITIYYSSFNQSKDRKPVKIYFIG